MRFKRSFFTLTVLLALLANAFAQQPASSEQREQASAPKEQPKAQAALERKALALLEEIITDAKSFNNPENRIILKVAAADLLWPSNEQRARALFKEAAMNLNEFLLSAGEQEEGATDEDFSLLNTRRELRTAMIQRLARHDARWARDLLRSTRPSTPAVRRGRVSVPDEELRLEQNLASQIAATDPKQALELAEETLSKGLSEESLQTVALLMSKDRQAATRLASKIITKLRTENLTDNMLSMSVAFSLFALATRPPTEPQAEATQRPTATKEAATQTPLLSQEELRDLAEMIIAASLANASREPYLLKRLQPYMAEIERYAPARVPELRRKLAAANQGVTRGGGIDANLQQTLTGGTVESMLEAASKAPEGTRQFIYQRAAMKAVGQGDVERARQIANDQITEPVMRRQVLKEIEQQQLMAAASSGKMEQVRQVLTQLRTPTERVMMLMQLALIANAKGDKKGALAFLDEARGLTSERARNYTQLGAQLLVVRAYAQLDAAKSLALLEPIIDQLNELIAAGAVLGSFFSEEIVRDDEIQIGMLYKFGFMAISEFGADLTALARADFERTRAAADRFQRPEVRILARLLVAQSILDPSAATGQMPDGFVIPDTTDIQPVPVIVDEP